MLCGGQVLLRAPAHLKFRGERLCGIFVLKHQRGGQSEPKSLPDKENYESESPKSGGSDGPLPQPNRDTMFELWGLDPCSPPHQQGLYKAMAEKIFIENSQIFIKNMPILVAF